MVTTILHQTSTFPLVLHQTTFVRAIGRVLFLCQDYTQLQWYYRHGWLTGRVVQLFHMSLLHMLNSFPLINISYKSCVVSQH